MPELPEVEITARRIGAAVAGAQVESATAPGLNALKTFDPPLDSLTGRGVASVGRRGKHLVVGFEGDLFLLVHLMSAGRLQLYDKRASLRDRTSRLLVRIADGGAPAAEGGGSGELRLREFGTKQAAWVKVLRAPELEEDPALATLGPDAWPQPPDDLRERPAAQGARPLHSVLRDQRVIAGIGRSWVDEILWTAQLSPFERATDLTEEQETTLKQAMHDVLAGALRH